MEKTVNNSKEEQERIEQEKMKEARERERILADLDAMSRAAFFDKEDRGWFRLFSLYSERKLEREKEKNISKEEGHQK